MRSKWRIMTFHNLNAPSWALQRSHCTLSVALISEISESKSESYLEIANSDRDPDMVETKAENTLHLRSSRSLTDGLVTRLNLRNASLVPFTDSIPIE